MEEEFLRLKRNIINWYPFKENSSKLEIWEGIIEENNENLQYDYVVIIGLGEKNINQLIEDASKKLKPEGILLIVVENKFGIENLCVENTHKSNKISRKTLEKLLDSYEYTNRKFYYPMPNYKVTNVIFTDEFLPNFETINRSLPLYDDNVLVALEEKSRFQALIEDDVELFKNFANSFMVECKKGTLEENDISFVSYANIRKPEYRIQTIIKKENVYKKNNDETAKAHIEDIKNNINILKTSNIKTIDTYDEEQIISKCQNTELLLDKVIINNLENGQTEHAMDIIEGFKNELQEKLEKSEEQTNCFDKYKIDYNPEDISKLHFIKNGLWDLIFQNCFYIENEFYFYDQEWFEENIPVEFIMYRAIKYFDKISNYISKEELYKKLNITEKVIEVFEALDNELQSQIRDEKIWKSLTQKDIRNILSKTNKLEQENIHLNAVVTQYSDHIKNLENGMEEAKKIIEGQSATIAQQNTRISQQDNQINSIVNSKSWKITKPLRSASKIIKGDTDIKE